MIVGVDEALAATSRTFHPCVSGLPPGLREAVSAAYLCLRAIDEIEDHPTLTQSAKTGLLRGSACLLRESAREADFLALFHDHALPQVTLRIHDWTRYAPTETTPLIRGATAVMADRMAGWAIAGWSIRTEPDLDRYTFDVAGSVGLLLCDLWTWHDETTARRDDAVALGRGLQAVNILRNHAEDLRRGIDFFPTGWDTTAMHDYAHRQLTRADRYIQELPPGPALTFSRVPLALARATLSALERGEQKLTRAAVRRILDGQR